MCKHPYTAKWAHSKRHCPSFVFKSNEQRGKKEGDIIDVKVKYREWAYFDSMAHYWSQWYEEYLNADYPRLMVRFEDLQYHAREMVDVICQCAGAVPRSETGAFTYVVDSAKSFGPGHGAKKKRTNLISAMIKYGSDEHRLDGMTKEDLEYASKHLSQDMMSLFDYNIPVVP
jgi:hypothetical protein